MMERPLFKRTVADTLAQRKTAAAAVDVAVAEADTFAQQHHTVFDVAHAVRLGELIERASAAVDDLDLVERQLVGLKIAAVLDAERVRARSHRRRAVDLRARHATLIAHIEQLNSDRIGRSEQTYAELFGEVPGDPAAATD